MAGDLRVEGTGAAEELVTRTITVRHSHIVAITLRVMWLTAENGTTFETRDTCTKTLGETDPRDRLSVIALLNIGQ